LETHKFDYRRDGPVNTLVFGLFEASKFVSIGFRLHDRLTNRKTTRQNAPNFDTWFFGLYVLAWLAALLVILQWAPLTGNWGLAFAALAIYRLQDMILGTIGDAFVFNTIGGTGGSKVLLAVVNIFQIVVIFAIAFYVLLSNSAFMPPAPTGRFGHLFLSWSTLPPLGGGFVAQTTRARALVMVESAAGVLLTVIALSRFLSAPDLGESAVASAYGQAQFDAGAVTVADPAAEQGSTILLTPQGADTEGTLRVAAEKGRFTITSSVATDSGVVAYEIRSQL
jgi:hypothetical protein